MWTAKEENELMLQNMADGYKTHIRQNVRQNVQHENFVTFVTLDKATKGIVNLRLMFHFDVAFKIGAEQMRPHQT